MLLILGPRQLDSILRVYVDHYNRERTHRALGRCPPAPPLADAPVVVAVDQVCGVETRPIPEASVPPGWRRAVCATPSVGIWLLLRGLRDGGRLALRVEPGARSDDDQQDDVDEEPPAVVAGV